MWNFIGNSSEAITGLSDTMTEKRVGEERTNGRKKEKTKN